MANKKASREERRRQRQAQKRQRTLITIGAIILFVGFLSYMTFQQSGSVDALPAASVPDPTLGVEETETGNDTAASDTPDSNTSGATNQPIVEIVEYGDFGCHACQLWHESGIRERILTDYGDQVRFVWRDFPVITANSPLAAEAGHCAGAQDKFWEYHDHVYENLAGLRKNQLVNYAKDIGLDEEQFQMCLDQGLMKAKVQSNEQQARAIGLRGTPGFTVNGRPLSGPPSYDTLASLIQSAGQ
ncbi:MAG: thioredoxin domain-containing protein [Chloroflexota bacterium]